MFYAVLFGIKEVLERFWSRIVAETSVILVVFLSSFGIYLGRYLRFNSWDVVSDPNELFDEIGNHFIYSTINSRAAGVTLLFGAFLLVGYWLIQLCQMGSQRTSQELGSAD